MVEIKTGQLWEEVDPRFSRQVVVLEIVSLTQPKGVLIMNAQNQRKNWASASRFNGKRGGYRLLGLAPEFQMLGGGF